MGSDKLVPKPQNEGWSRAEKLLGKIEGGAVASRELDEAPDAGSFVPDTHQAVDKVRARIDEIYKSEQARDDEFDRRNVSRRRVVRDNERKLNFRQKAVRWGTAAIMVVGGIFGLKGLFEKKPNFDNGRNDTPKESIVKSNGVNEALQANLANNNNVDGLDSVTVEPSPNNVNEIVKENFDDQREKDKKGQPLNDGFDPKD